MSAPPEASGTTRTVGIAILGAVQKSGGWFQDGASSPRYRDYLPPAGTTSAASSAKAYERPELGTGSVLVYPPHRTGRWRAIWQQRDTERHETTESDTFAEVMRWAFARTDSVHMVELHASVVGGPSTTPLAPLPPTDTPT
jgi:hypothetical protein